MNLGYQRANRVLPFPFHFLDNNRAMNVKPLNYSWDDFYARVIDLGKHTFSARAIVNRLRATNAFVPKWMNVVRAVSSEGHGRIKYHTEVLRSLGSDPAFRAYFDGESERLPSFYEERIKKDLGPLWSWLPAGASFHDPNAYLKSVKDGETTGEPGSLVTVMVG
jgi:hypothetical protein